MSSNDYRPIDLSSVDHVMNTTRSVRLRLDFEREVPDALLKEALAVALQAPTGANTQTWRFVVVRDAAKRRAIADFYRSAAADYVEGRTGLSRTGVTMMREYAADDPRQQQREAMMKSGGYLMEHLERAPVMIIPCIEGRFETDDVFTQASMWGSILPATWSLMMALRARRLASAWTTLHLRHEQAVAELLGIPHQYYMQVALIPLAYTKGTHFKPAYRPPIETVMHIDTWS